MPEPAREPEASAAPPQPTAAPASPGAAPAGPQAARLLALQRAIGNRAVGRLLAREPMDGYQFSDDPLADGGFGPGDKTIRVKPGPVRATTIGPDIDAYLAEAKRRSPTARKEIERAAKKGYSFGFVSSHAGADTSEAAGGVSINPTGLSHDQILIRIFYEAGNLANLDLFADVRRRREAGEFKTGEEYARAKLGTESITVVDASLKALEAGLKYDKEIDKLVAGATKPDPTAPGGLTWKTPKDRDRVFKAAETYVWNNASLEDPDNAGHWIPAREFYKTH
jgi:hypothetical protein